MWGGSIFGTLNFTASFDSDFVAIVGPISAVKSASKVAKSCKVLFLDPTMKSVMWDFATSKL